MNAKLPPPMAHQLYLFCSIYFSVNSMSLKLFCFGWDQGNATLNVWLDGGLGMMWLKMDFELIFCWSETTKQNIWWFLDDECGRLSPKRSIFWKLYETSSMNGIYLFSKINPVCWRVPGGQLALNAAVLSGVLEDYVNSDVVVKLWYIH